MTRRSRTTLLVAGLLAALAVPAAAQDGVVVDPDSPTGKEYALPLESARNQASSEGGGSGVGPGGDGTPAPLFGEGVGDDAAQPAGAGGTSGSKEGGGADGTQDAGTSQPDRGEGGSAPTAAGSAPQADSDVQRALRAAASRPGAPEGGTSVLLIGGIGVVALLVGAAAGLLLRRRRQPS